MVLTDPIEILAGAGVRLPHPCVIERDENGCAVWPFGKTASGYGICYPVTGQHQAEYVHRLVCEAFNGPIPEGWFVDHVWQRGCRSRACFWPEHLEAVTPDENARRMGVARRERAPRPCGHSWDDNRPGRSDCAVCHREREARRSAARSRPARDRVRQIRLLLQADQMRDGEIAQIVGVSRMTVSRIRRGLSHADVY